MDLDLNKYGLLKVGPVSQKVKVDRSVIVKLTGIGNVVAQVFVKKCVVRFETEFPLVPAMDNRSCAFEIRLAEGVLLEDFDGSRFRVGVETVGVIAAHHAKISGRVGRKAVLVGRDAHRLDVLGGLALARGLLYQFVRDIVARQLV